MQKNMKDRITSLSLLSTLSKAAIGRQLGAAPGTLGDWESGRSRPGPEALERLDLLEEFFQKYPPLKPRRPGKRARRPVTACASVAPNAVQK